MTEKKKIFISYTYETDRQYKNLLIAWDKNKQFDFFISDYSADVSINSTDASAIKRTISRYISEATTFLVIIGKETHKSNWVRWEINKAVELGKILIAVKTDQNNISPDELLNVGTTWAMSFTYAAITSAIGSA